VNVPTFLARVQTDEGEEWVRRAAWAVLALAVLAFVVRGASGPADPFLATSSRVPLKGFGEVAFTVTDPAGAIAEWCALLAETQEQRAQGLMGQRDLRGYDAMVFRYAEPSDGAFYMKDTLIPLSVAFFDAEGRFVHAADMDPCPPEVENCPTYPSTAPYVHAIEVPKGNLGGLGVTAGSTISFPGTPCPT
jgi:uncharacterized membrane protein (UPF0127 family)